MRTLTTKRDLEAQTEQMSKATGRRYYISYAYGKARLVMADGGGQRDISPRMSKGEVMAWIAAWWAGYNTALATLEGRGVNLKVFLNAKALEAPTCPACGSDNVGRQGEQVDGVTGYTCGACGLLFEMGTCRACGEYGHLDSRGLCTCSPPEEGPEDQRPTFEGKPAANP